MKQWFFAALMVISTTSVASDYNGITDNFFSALRSASPENAVNPLYETNKWISSGSDQVTYLKGQLGRLEGLVGKYLFHELILEEKVGTHYVHLIYLVGYERQPLRFELKLYKVGDKWRLQGVGFDTDLTDDVEKLANAKLIE